MTKMPWPGPQFMMPGLAVYALDDAIACLSGPTRGGSAALAFSTVGFLWRSCNKIMAHGTLNGPVRRFLARADREGRLDEPKNSGRRVAIPIRPLPLLFLSKKQPWPIKRAIRSTREP